MVELNCETDFVAKTDNFIRGIELMTESIHHAQSDLVFTGKESIEETAERLNALTLHKPIDDSVSSQNFEDGLKFLISKVQENCKIGRVYQRRRGEGEVFGSYVHNHLKPGIGKIGSIVMLENCDNKQEKGVKGAVQVAMHAAAMNPLYLNESQIPEEIKKGELEQGEKKLKAYIS